MTLPPPDPPVLRFPPSEQARTAWVQRNLRLLAAMVGREPSMRLWAERILSPMFGTFEEATAGRARWPRRPRRGPAAVVRERDEDNEPPRR